MGRGNDKVEDETRWRQFEDHRLQREIALQEAIAERQSAYRMATERERATWIILGGTATAIVSLFSAIFHKNMSHSIIAVPSLAVVVHQMDICYGNQGQRIKNMADKLLNTSSVLLPFPSSAEVRFRMRELENEGGFDGIL